MQKIQLTDVFKLEGDDKIEALSSILFNSITLNSTALYIHQKVTFDSLLKVLSQYFNLDILCVPSTNTVLLLDQDSVITLASCKELDTALHIINHRLLSQYQYVMLTKIGIKQDDLSEEGIYCKKTIALENLQSYIKNLLITYLLDSCEAYVKSVDDVYPYIENRNYLISNHKSEWLSKAELISAIESFQNSQSVAHLFADYENLHQDWKTKQAAEVMHLRNLKAISQTFLVFLVISILTWSLLK